MVALAVLDRFTYMRLMSTAENVLYGLRTRAFAHVHDLSLAHHNESKTGVLVARVTSDIETLAQFASWGAISWVVNLDDHRRVAAGDRRVPVAAGDRDAARDLLPIVPIMRRVQKRQLRAYDDLRTKVSDTLSAISETIGGIRVIRVLRRESPPPAGRCTVRSSGSTAASWWPGSTSPSCSRCPTCSAG